MSMERKHVLDDSPDSRPQKRSRLVDVIEDGDYREDIDIPRQNALPPYLQDILVGLRVFRSESVSISLNT